MYLFELRPNSSLTPGAAFAFFMSVAILLTITATTFAARGLWLVLPFAGLELAGIGAALHWSLRRGRQREYIRIDERAVVVRREFAGRGHGREIELPRPWTRIEYVRAAVRHWPGHLFFRSGKNSVEVGSFLTEGERLGLKARLDEVMSLAGTPPSADGAGQGTRADH